MAEVMKFNYSFLIFFVFAIGCQHPWIVDNKSKNEIKMGGYHLYVGNWGGNEVYIVDTNSNIIVDTLQGFDYYIWDLAVTLSGAKLYVSTKGGPHNTPGKIFAVDLCSKSTSLIWSGIASDVFVSPQGQPLIISHEPRPENAPEGISYVGFIDTLSDVIAFVDTLNIRDNGFNYQSIVFDKNRPLFYAVDNARRLFAYDYDQKKIRRNYDNLFDPLQMIISNDSRFLYVAGGPVFDLERDEVIASVGGDRLGSLALSPDGEYIYVTEPGNHGLLEPLPRGKVFIFHTSTNSYIGEIDVKKIVQSLPTGQSWQTDRIVLTTDGKIAYVSSWIKHLFTIDLQSREVIKVMDFNGFTIPLMLGTKPR